METELEDLIYEAAVNTELWPSVITRIAELSDTRGGGLFTFDGKITRFLTSSQEMKEFSEELIARFPNDNVRTARLMQQREASFLTDTDLFTDVEIRSAPVYRDFILPRGFGRSFATVIRSPSGELMAYFLEGPVSSNQSRSETKKRLNPLRRHLARASLLSTRLGFQRAQAAAQALEDIGLASGVLNSHGRLIAANRLLQSLIPNLFQDRRERLALTDISADRLFATALNELDNDQNIAGVRSIPIRDEEQNGYVVHLIPIRRTARDLFAVSSAIVTATPLRKEIATDAQLLEGLFDLTPAEARVARAIAEGKTTKQIAEANASSVTTVRNQLNRVLAKSGVHRQAELVALLAGAALGNRPWHGD